MRHKMERLWSKSPQLGTFKVTKIYLSHFDDKLYILEREIKILSYGYKYISQLFC